MRKLIGSVLAVLGAAATLVSPWQGWYGGRHGSTYKFWEVFGNGITVSRSGVTDSVFLVFLVAAVITVVGVLLRSGAVAVLGGVVALGFTVLWMVRQGQAAGELVVGGGGRGLGVGAAWALGGSALMIVGGLLMGARRRTRTVPASTTSPVTRAPDSPAVAEDDEPERQDTSSGATTTTTFTPEEARMLGLHEDIPADSPTAIPTTKPPTS